MVADRSFLAKVLYSLAGRGLFTAALLTDGLVNAAEPAKSTVIQVRDRVASQYFKPRPARVEAMLDTGLQQITRQTTTAAAWRTLFTERDVIGIKVNARAGPVAGTRPTVVAAVVDSLLRAGFKPGQLVIWDRHLRDLKNAGYETIYKKYNVSLAGAHEEGYDDWAPYRYAFLPWKPAIGELLHGRKASSDLSHPSKLVSEKLTAILCIHPPLYIPRTGHSGHLAELAQASADNTHRFSYYLPGFRDAIPALCDRVAFSHTHTAARLKRALDDKAVPETFALLPTTGKIEIQFNEHKFHLEALLSARKTAAAEGEPQGVSFQAGPMKWRQWVLPDGRMTLDPETNTKQLQPHTKLRLAITDALFCQYHQGNRIRTDYAVATNELWFSTDLLALDAIGFQMVEDLRRSANLPPGIGQNLMHRTAQRMLLGNAFANRIEVKLINQTFDEP